MSELCNIPEIERSEVNAYDFLINNSIENVEKTIKLSERFPFDFKIKAISCDEVARIRSASMQISSDGKTKFDYNKMVSLTIVECTVYPNFGDAEFLKKLKAVNGREAINKVLLPGEKDRLYNAINELCGYRDLNVEIDTVKKP